MGAGERAQDTLNCAAKWEDVATKHTDVVALRDRADEKDTAPPAEGTTYYPGAVRADYFRPELAPGCRQFAAPRVSMSDENGEEWHHYCGWLASSLQKPMFGHLIGEDTGGAVAQRLRLADLKAGAVPMMTLPDEVGGGVSGRR